ncbi:MAG TPA: hypothetical protein VIS94_16720 [Desulfomonilia bacterium]
MNAENSMNPTGLTIKNSRIIRLNYADFIYLTMEDVNIAQGDLLMLRFREAHPEREIRDAARHLLTIYPRLRSLLEPTLFSYRLRILDETDERIELFFNNAFRVIPKVGYNSSEFLSARRNFYNEPFSLFQTLPVKILYFPDDPTPVLLFSIHHVVGDGFSCLHMMGSLMAYLNGKKTDPVPVDDTSLLPALANHPWYTLPSQFIKSVKSMIEDSRQTPKGHLIQATDRPVNFFGPVDVHQQALKYDLSLIRSSAKELGVSITTLILAALAVSLTRGRNVPGDIAVIIVSVNLRPYYPERKPVIGNYITGFMIRLPRKLWDDDMAIIRDIHSQMTHKIGRIEKRQTLASGLAAKMSTLLGKKNYARIIRLAKRAGILAKTGALANLGNMDSLNSYGQKAQLCELLASSPSHGLFVTMNTLDEKVFVSYNFQEAEFTRDEVQACMARFEECLGEILDKIQPPK